MTYNLVGTFYICPTPIGNLNDVSARILETLKIVLPYAVTAALVGLIESLLTLSLIDDITNTRGKANKESIGQGIGNSIAAFFGGIPGAGATIRTVVNIDAGGKTKLSGMIAGLLLLIVLMLLGPLAAQIPKAVLAGILVTVGIGVMDMQSLKTMHKQPITDVIVMLLVLLLTVFWDLIFAVGIGVLVHYAILKFAPAKK